MVLPVTGEYVIPDGLNLLRVNREDDLAVYHEENLWMQHRGRASPEDPDNHALARDSGGDLAAAPWSGWRRHSDVVHRREPTLVRNTTSEPWPSISTEASRSCQELRSSRMSAQAVRISPWPASGTSCRWLCGNAPANTVANDGGTATS
jgi:hypothetical protein